MTTQGRRWQLHLGLVGGCWLLVCEAGAAPVPTSHELEHLKSVQQSQTADEEVAILLAQAYERRGNHIWAQRTLSRYLEDNPKACNPRLLLAWSKLEQGMVHQARRLLDEAACSAPTEVYARYQLVSAQLALLEARPKRAMELVESARRAPRIYEEDLPLLLYLMRTTAPNHLPTATGKLAFASGWTSNGLASSPTDTGSEGGTSSPLSLVDAQLRLYPMTLGTLRPLLAGHLRAHQLWAAEASDYSFRTAGLQTGVMLLHPAALLTALVTTDATQIQKGDRYDEGPLWFSESRRLQVELERPGALLLAVGGGRRDFREAGRSRNEFDASVGWFQTHKSWAFVNGASARYYDAKKDAYDQHGMTFVSQLRVELPAHLAISQSVGIAADSYDLSSGYFVPASNRERRDIQWQTKTAITSPSLYAVRLAAKYELTMRRSSIESFDFTDHRLLLGVDWSYDSDRWGRTTVGKRGRAAAEYVLLSRGTGTEANQLRELMRQDETQRQSSTCSK